MFTKSVKVTIILDGEPTTVTVTILCSPNTPKAELIRRARNIFRAAALDAKYKVIK